MKQKWKSFGRALRPTRKKVIVLVVVVVLALAAWRMLSGGAPAATPMAGPVERSVTLQRTTLNDSITVTGTVESGSTANVTTQLTAPVKEILVQVGDAVQEGDIIARLDASDLQQQLARLQKSAGNESENSQRSYTQAQENLATAQSKLSEALSTYTSASSTLNAARNAYMPAWNSIQSFQNTYQQALSAEQQAGAALNSMQGSRDTAAAQLASGQSALAAAADDAARAAAQAQIDAANAAIAQADSQLPALQSAYETAVSTRKSAEEALNNAKTTCNYDALLQAYSSADTACQQAKSAYETAKANVTQAENTLATAQDALENGSTADQIQDLQEQIEDCTLTAGMSGTVTSIGATVGSAANQSVVAVIQNTDQLKLAVTIDEDDIKKVAVGQKAIIQSDATGEEEISGTVSQVSVTATSSQNGQAGGFSAEIAVDGAGSGLLVGLSAQAEIIFTQVADVYAVPYDAVSKDENGQDVIYVREEGGSWQPVAVTVGMETDYYVEVSGEDLEEGQEVLVSANDTAQAQPADSAGMAQTDGDFAFAIGPSDGPAPGGGAGGRPNGPMGG